MIVLSLLIDGRIRRSVGRSRPPERAYFDFRQHRGTLAKSQMLSAECSTS
jgi:hypothetical protein